MPTPWKVQNGDETIFRGGAYSPPGCHPVGCGVKLHVKDGKLVEVEGDVEHPVTRGSLCPRCLAIKEVVYHPDRVIYPMRRAREDRGKNTWERCTWDEALDLIKENADRVIERYGHNAIVVFGGTGREATHYYNTIAHAVFGSANACYAQSGWSCFGPRLSFTTFSMGYGMPDMDNASQFHDTYANPNWDPPKIILLWGKEPLKSNPDGFYGHSIIEMMRYFGTRVIMVDPRMTWLGTRSEEVLRLRPGTDAALAMAMLNVIVTEDLYDHDFVDKWCYGFDELAERVQTMSTAEAAKICWVPEEQIIRVAREIATTHPVSIGWGLAVDQNPNGAQVAQCIIALNAITGNYDIPGGTRLGRLNISPISSPAGWALDGGVMTKEDYAQRIGNDTFPAVNAVMPTAAPDAILDCLETDDPQPLRMAMFQSSNVIGSAISSAPGRWYAALKDKMEFCFGSDLFMNPTIMALCEVFLPLATWVEHDALVDPNYGQNISYLGSVNKVVTVGECKSDIEIMLALGKKMLPDFWNQFEDEDDFLENRQLVCHKMTVKELKENVVTFPEDPYRKYEVGLLRADGKPGFMTPTGRIELYSNVFKQYGDDPLPYFTEPPYGPNSTPELMEEFPFVLTTGARTYVSFHSEHRQIPSLRQMVPDPLVELHPDVAADMNIKEGDWVWIESPFGRCQERAHFTPAIDPRVVHAMHGWWYPEADPEEPSLFGNWKSNINLTMPHKVNGRLGYGDCFKNMICKIYKVSDENAEVKL